MSDTPEQPTPETHALPKPEVKHSSGWSLIWLIPITTLIAGLWLLAISILERGPLITIHFKDAESIEAGKTPIRYKNIQIGLVESVRFDDDYQNIAVEARMDNDIGHLLRRGSRFWVVKPRLGLREVSGLGTLLSGGYIELDPGEGKASREFQGLEKPPVVRTDSDGTRIQLIADKLGSIDIGSRIYYQGIEAGEVLGYQLGDDQKSVFIHAFVRAPYDSLVQGNTRFWNASGVDMSLDANGVKVSTESLQSVLFGGIAFNTPKTLEPIDTDKQNLSFKLYDSQEAVEEQRFAQKIYFVLFFEGSVRGLAIDAPVEFKGIKIGSVKDVRLEFDPSDTSFRIPVLIEVEPERIITRIANDAKDPQQLLATLVQRGLRARLSTGSLLTGARYVDLDMHPDTPITLLGDSGPYPELPTIPAQIDEFTGAIKQFLVKLNKLDIQGLSNELVGAVQDTRKILQAPEIGNTLKGVDQLVNNRELQDSISAVKSTLISLDAILAMAKKETQPVTRELKSALKAAQQALDRSKTTMSKIDQLLTPSAPLQSGIIESTEELNETLRAIRALVETLERNPEAILYGKKPAP